MAGLGRRQIDKVIREVGPEPQFGLGKSVVSTSERSRLLQVIAEVVDQNNAELERELQKLRSELAELKRRVPQ
jgi:hypothetical protein